MLLNIIIVVLSVSTVMGLLLLLAYLGMVEKARKIATFVIITGTILVVCITFSSCSQYQCPTYAGSNPHHVRHR
jgi:hypothetical protein